MIVNVVSNYKLVNVVNELIDLYKEAEPTRGKLVHSAYLCGGDGPLPTHFGLAAKAHVQDH